MARTIAIVLLGIVLIAAALPPSPPNVTALPARVRRIVLHTLGGPFYGKPEMRYVFLRPIETFALWARPGFGAHWIVWTDGTLWPRHPAPGERPFVAPPGDAPLSEAWRRRLAREAAPVYAHVQGANRDTVGIELAHSGRSGEPFPAAQARTVAWLVRALIEMSGGRLSESSVTGHKDLDAKPAYVDDNCRGAGCPYYVDAAGQPFRRRVDPPEGLFGALAELGLRIPRSASEGDLHLRRAEALGGSEMPSVVRP